MTSRKFRAALTAGMVTLALLLGAGTAQAATVVTSDDGTNATGILGLEVGTTLYDVQFVRSTPQGLYSIPPGFDFANEGEATDANGVVITVLNTNPAVMTVGPSATPSNVYLIGYEFDEGGLGDPEFEVTEAKYQNGWKERGNGELQR